MPIILYDFFPVFRRFCIGFARAVIVYSCCPVWRCLIIGLTSLQWLDTIGTFYRTSPFCTAFSQCDAGSFLVSKDLYAVTGRARGPPSVRLFPSWRPPTLVLQKLNNVTGNARDLLQVTAIVYAFEKNKYQKYAGFNIVFPQYYEQAVSSALTSVSNEAFPLLSTQSGLKIEYCECAHIRCKVQPISVHHSSARWNWKV